ncbi:hypothetical protein GS399_10465 [Pedobacter sp. HMF7647]|uniref:Outer membrane beta-barrel protein n=1 Tax=Hufsiella arboris TaxID=2695275 RepID=A0A7K1Y9W6_9SPHI|nr:hypothetical protein [Hufsiella arboris]MXV51393.1 hypothetical protein [Hufsiella arboris]
MRIFTLSIICFFVVLKVSGQSSLNWMLSTQAGLSSHTTTNYQGSLMIGFATQNNQQISVGPVIKSFFVANHQQANIGGRIYSQSPIVGPLSLYLQCDIFQMNMSPAQYTPEKKLKLDAGLGAAFTFNNNIGLAAGYNFGEFNPMTSTSKGVGNLRIFYNLPLTQK